MDAQQAQTFESGKSEASIAFLATIAEDRGCTCEPYVDWFTYKRWKAQGMQVQRGEKGTKMPVWITKEYQQDDGSTVERTYRRTTYVFCRCQVKPKEAN